MTRLTCISRAIFAAIALLGFALAAPAQQSNKAQLRIYLPSLDAQLEIQGIPQKVLNPPKDVRLFISPELEPGKNYTYDVKVTWTKDGKQLTRERSVRVTAGQTSELDLRQENDKTSDLSPPKPGDLPLDRPPEKPADKPADKPQDKPADKHADKPMDKPADKPIEKPLDKPTEPPMPPSFVAPPPQVVDYMLEFANVGSSDVVYDLCSGDGRIALDAVMKRKARKAVGIEHNSDRVAEARRAAATAGGKVEFRQDDVTSLSEKDLSEATVITIGACSQEQLTKLAPKLAKLKPGTRIVVHEFELPKMTPTKQVEQTVGGLDHRISLYTIK